jgi:ABC-type Fe3+-siderophore transport system permease subunit
VGVLCASVGAGFGLVTYVLVAPFRCAASGACSGLVAFDYPPDSPGHWQAVGAGAVVGATVALLLFAALAEGRSQIALRIVLTPLLLAAIGISALSQSVLILLGPTVGSLVLWRLWSGQSRSKSPMSEPPPFYDRP